LRCRYTTGTGYSACYRNYIPQMWCRYAKMRRVWIAGVITKGEYKSVMAFRLTGQDKRAKQESNAAAAISFIFFRPSAVVLILEKKRRAHITHDGQQPMAVSPSFSMLHIILSAFVAVVVVTEFVTPSMRSIVHVGEYPGGQARPREYIGGCEAHFPMS
jgi:hypothetical protein